MPTELDLAQHLFEAQMDGHGSVDATLFAGLDRDSAYRVMLRVMDMLGERPGMLKTAIGPDGQGMAAPIFASRVGESGPFSLPASRIVGLEVEVGLVVGRDLDTHTARHDPASITDAVDYYFVGVEVCGSRYIDRKLAGTWGGLADSMTAFGYVINPKHREFGADIAGYELSLDAGDRQIFNGPAKHGFGTVLASFEAYAKNQHPDLPLKAGTIVTTGSLCGLVPTNTAGHVVAKLGTHVVEFDLT